VAKPFHFAELEARLAAVMRRSGGWASPTLQCGPIVLDTRAQTVAVDGAAVDLTTYEYRILEQLMLHAGEVISKTTSPKAKSRTERRQCHRSAIVRCAQADPRDARRSNAARRGYWFALARTRIVGAVDPPKRSVGGGRCVVLRPPSCADSSSAA
jgi:hypothetical protein